MSAHDASNVASTLYALLLDGCQRQTRTVAETAEAISDLLDADQISADAKTEVGSTAEPTTCTGHGFDTWIDLTWLLSVQGDAWPTTLPAKEPSVNTPSSLSTNFVPGLPSNPKSSAIASPSPGSARTPQPAGNAEQGPTATQLLTDVTKALLHTHPNLPREPLLVRWEPVFLQSVGLVPSAPIFNKRIIRLKTERLYRQTKFNLLREESEGFSRLIEVVVSAAEVTDRDTALIDLRRSAAVLRARLDILTGYFSLDPNRVLSLILDVFQETVCDHYPFFLEVLRQSTVVGLQGTAEDEDDAQPPIQETAPHSIRLQRGSPRLGEALAFQFAFTGSPTLDQGDSKDTVASEIGGLYRMAALLLHNGLVRIADLYPYLTPSDAEQRKSYDTFTETMSRAAGQTSSSSLADMPSLDDLESGRAVLPGSRSSGPAAPTATTTGEAAIAAIEPVSGPDPDQKPRLLAALLEVGELPLALDFLGRFPRIAAGQPAIQDALNRCLRAMVEPTYRSAFPDAPQPDQGSVPQSFYRDWTRNIPGVPTEGTAMDVDGDPLDFDAPTPGDPLLATLWPWLGYCGLGLARDPALLTQLCRLGSQRLAYAIDSLAADTNLAADPVFLDWQQWAREYLLPNLSLITEATDLLAEAWRFLFQFPVTARYGMYGEWKNTSYPRYPELKVVSTRVISETRAALRRLSTKTVKAIGRQLARISDANPTLVFTIALDQVQAYDNLIAPLVEACEYLSAFSFDVLCFALMDAIANPLKPRLKPDGTNVAAWLRSLAMFAATLARLYPDFDLNMFMQLTLHNFRRGRLTDLVLVTDLVTKMTGIELLPAVGNAHQLQMLAGGNLLIQEALTPLPSDEIFASRASPRSIARLITTLQQDATRAILTSHSTASAPAAPLTAEEIATMRWTCRPSLLSALLVLLAQTRRGIVFQYDAAQFPAKLLSHFYDQTKESLQQVEYMARLNLPANEYVRALPSLYELCCDYSVEPEVAWQLIRPVLRHLYQTYLGQETQPTEDESAPSAEAGAVANGSAEVSTPASPIATASATPPEAGSTEDPVDVWLPFCVPLFNQVQEILPTSIWQRLTPRFYVTFWRLGLDDIYVPRERYVETAARLRQRAHALTTPSASSLGASGQGGYYASPGTRRPPVSSSSQRQAEKLRATADQLPREAERQVTLVERNLAQARRESPHWFTGDQEVEKRYDLVEELYQSCLLPRVLNSANDATFCAQWIQLMHQWGTPNFWTLQAYNVIFKDITGVLFSCTEMESHFFGQFLDDCLAVFIRWYQDVDQFEREARGRRIVDEAKYAKANSVTASDGKETGAQKWARKIAAESSDSDSEDGEEKVESEGDDEEGAMPETKDQLKSDPAPVPKPESEAIPEDDGVRYLPGFRLTWPSGPHRLENETALKGDQLMPHHTFLTVLKRWHQLLNANFIAALDSTDYIHRRNAILVLSRIQNRYPFIAEFGETLANKVDAIFAAEAREDLKILTLGYKAVLKKHSPRWVPFQLFLKGKTAAAPSPVPMAKSLSATAPAFRPGRLAPAATAPASARLSPSAVVTGPSTRDSTSNNLPAARQDRSQAPSPRVALGPIGASVLAVEAAPKAKASRDGSADSTPRSDNGRSNRGREPRDRKATSDASISTGAASTHPRERGRDAREPRDSDRGGRGERESSRAQERGSQRRADEQPAKLDRQRSGRTTPNPLTSRVSAPASRQSSRERPSNDRDESAAPPPEKRVRTERSSDGIRSPTQPRTTASQARSSNEADEESHRSSRRTADLTPSTQGGRRGRDREREAERESAEKAETNSEGPVSRHGRKERGSRASKDESDRKGRDRKRKNDEGAGSGAPEDKRLRSDDVEPARSPSSTSHDRSSRAREGRGRDQGSQPSKAANTEQPSNVGVSQLSIVNSSGNNSPITSSFKTTTRGGGGGASSGRRDGSGRQGAGEGSVGGTLMSPTGSRQSTSQRSKDLTTRDRVPPQAAPMPSQSEVFGGHQQQARNGSGQRRGRGDHRNPNNLALPTPSLAPVANATSSQGRTAGGSESRRDDGGGGRRRQGNRRG
ncbi:THO2 plays a role in transcriptional elongation [Tieghemiomyces parasiticus]|uniref:THO complex subunit 2 n=1 Tax=Tieghemiomyces parasiticus TaxID=78921 RepID=A0A9W8DZH7_9FUNG|nr:THO2 plays a role in transcriptional elongation [Tieghemiomyces parasiticus]